MHRIVASLVVLLLALSPLAALALDVADDGLTRVTHGHAHHMAAADCLDEDCDEEAAVMWCCKAVIGHCATTVLPVTGHGFSSRSAVSAVAHWADPRIDPRSYVAVADPPPPRP